MNMLSVNFTIRVLLVRVRICLRINEAHGAVDVIRTTNLLIRY